MSSQTPERKINTQILQTRNSKGDDPSLLLSPSKEYNKKVQLMRASFSRTDLKCTRLCKPCQVKNLIFFDILILQRASNTNPLLGEGLNKIQKKDLHKKPSNRLGLQTRTSLLTSLELNSPVKDKRENLHRFSIGQWTTKTKREIKMRRPLVFREEHKNRYHTQIYKLMALSSLKVLHDFFS